MQAAIEKRGRELVGIGLVLLGLMAAMLIGSYTPDDPSFMVASDAPVNNWLGRTGASIAAPLFMIVGRGAWLLPIVLIAWGVRLALHMGAERAIGRLIFAPIAIALGSIYAATLAPGAEWTHSFGLGGLFGDTILLVVLQVIPGTAALGAKVVSFLVGIGMVAMTTFVLGFVRAELWLISRYMIVGVILSYAMLMNLLGRGAKVGAIAARKSAETARTMQANRNARREAEYLAYQETDNLFAEESAYGQPQRGGVADPEAHRVASVIRAQPTVPTADLAPSQYDTADYAAPPAYMPEPAPYVEEAPKTLLGRLGVLRRSEPVIEEPVFEEIPYEAPRPTDRVGARIHDAIQARARTGQPVSPPPTSTAGLSHLRPEPAVTRGRAAQPMVLTDEPAVVPAAPAYTRRPAPAAPVSAPAARAPMADTVPQEPMMAPPVPDPMTEIFEQDYAYEAEVLDDSVPAPEMPSFVPSPRVETPVKRVVQHAPKKPLVQSHRAKAEAQPTLKFEDKLADYEHPPLNLLMNPIEVQRHHLSDDALEENARMLESVLDDYGVKGEIVSVRPGPVVTMYELEPAAGLKASRVIGLSDDIARSMSALSARVSTVPGRTVIGIELPNASREKVVLREILSSRDFGDSNMKLPLALGKDIGGDPIVANLAKMPHLLIAGTTGSGKSVAINTMILSLLYKLSPAECRLIMIDPKMLELSVYDGIPHLLSPVVTDPKKAVVALKWTVGEMEERYRKMSKMGVRNIEGYNSRVKEAQAKNEMFSRTVQTGFDEDSGEPIFETEEFAPETLPYIVVVVDEMADLMMVAGKEIEACIQRLAQMARASGIHLIMATQRPSVDVITGTIKANFPTRISFQVTSKIDSRTILGEMGAEQLLGMGDMLYMAGGAKITRIHGPFCSDEEVEEIVNYLKSYGPPVYMSNVLDGPSEEAGSNIDAVLGLGGNTDTEDALYDTAVAIVIKDRKCSTSYIQRKLAIGYNKAARLVEQMEDQRIVSPANHVGKREILVPEQQH